LHLFYLALYAIDYFKAITWITWPFTNTGHARAGVNSGWRIREGHIMTDNKLHYLYLHFRMIIRVRLGRLVCTILLLA